MDTYSETSLREFVKAASQGDKNALEQVVKSIRDKVYALSLKMLWHPEDAEDASQEILIKVITNLSKFREESSFATWVYKIASNYLLTTRKRRAEQDNLTFDIFAIQLDEGYSDSVFRSSENVDSALLEEEVMVGCTSAMLLCLDRSCRIVYILGEILEIDSAKGSFILDMSASAYRKKLSRAREKIRNFMAAKCGVFDPNNRCRCKNMIKNSIENNVVAVDQLLFIDEKKYRVDKNLLEVNSELKDLEREVAIYRSSPRYTMKKDVGKFMRELIHSGKYPMLENKKGM